jgi:hypothetical protein
MPGWFLAVFEPLTLFRVFFDMKKVTKHKQIRGITVPYRNTCFGGMLTVFLCRFYSGSGAPSPITCHSQCGSISLLSHTLPSLPCVAGKTCMELTGERGLKDLKKIVLQEYNNFSPPSVVNFETKFCVLFSYPLIFICSNFMFLFSGVAVSVGTAAVTPPAPSVSSVELLAAPVHPALLPAKPCCEPVLPPTRPRPFPPSQHSAGAHRSCLPPPS